MNKPISSHPLSLASAFQQFLEVSSFVRRTRESYAEDLTPLIASVGQQPVTALTADVLQPFLVRQESLAPATYNRRLAALRSFTRWLRDQGWETEELLVGVGRKPERTRAAHDYTEVDLKRFSGHTSLRSLERYIADNREAAKRKARDWERRQH